MLSATQLQLNRSHLNSSINDLVNKTKQKFEGMFISGMYTMSLRPNKINGATLYNYIFLFLSLLPKSGEDWCQCLVPVPKGRCQCPRPRLVPESKSEDSANAWDQPVLGAGARCLM